MSHPLDSRSDCGPVCVLPQRESTNLQIAVSRDFHVVWCKRHSCTLGIDGTFRRVGGSTMTETDVCIVELGFVTTRVPIGSHVCQVYTEDEERDHCIAEFLLRGIMANEAVACFSDHCSQSKLRSSLEKHGVLLDQEFSSGRLTHASAEATYFENGTFDPARLIGLFGQFHAASVAQQRSGARIIGEMSPRVAQIQGGSRLLEYESRVNYELRERPATVVCQYAARAFDGAVLMDVLSVHPMLVVRGNVVQNPFYVPPEKYLHS